LVRWPTAKQWLASGQDTLHRYVGLTGATLAARGAALAVPAHKAAIAPAVSNGVNARQPRPARAVGTRHDRRD
jgi:hypothetical protein